MSDNNNTNRSKSQSLNWLGIPKDEFGIYLQVMGAAFFFFSIVIPYREVVLNKVLLGAIGLFALGTLVSFALNDFKRIMLVFLVFTPFQKELPADFGGILPALNATNIIVVFMLYGWFSQSFLKNRRIYTFRISDVFIFLFATLLLMSLLRAQWVSGQGFSKESLFNAKRLVMPYFIYFIYVNNIQSRRDVRFIQFATILVMTLVGLYVLKAFYLDLGGKFWGGSKGRILVLTNQPNQLGSIFVNYAMFIFAWFMHHLNKWHGWAALLSFGLCTQALRLTLSRGSILGYLLGVSVASVLCGFKRSMLFVSIGVALLVVAPEKVLGPRLFDVFQNVIRAKTENLDLKQTLDKSGYARIALVEAGINLLKSDPNYALFGIGMNRFSYEISKYNPDLAEYGWIEAHNTYLKIAVEMGLLCLTAFLVLLLSSFYYGFRLYFSSKDPFWRSFAVGSIAGTAGLMLSNWFGTRINSNEVIFMQWILYGTLVRSCEIVPEEKAEWARLQNPEEQEEPSDDPQEETQAIEEASTQEPISKTILRNRSYRRDRHGL